MALLSKKKEKWAIQRRKALKGVLVGKPINKNKHADVYYRTAMEKEFLNGIRQTNLRFICKIL